jgi:hypothetical protein
VETESAIGDHRRPPTSVVKELSAKFHRSAHGKKIEE